VFRPGFNLAIVSNFDATSANHDVLELDHALFRNADLGVPSCNLQFDPEPYVIDLHNTSLKNLSAQDFLLL
jgi:hypothetical protein